MLRFATAVACAAALFAPQLAFASVTVQSPDLSSSQSSAVASGEILVDVDIDGQVASGVVTAVVEAPPAEVFAIISDFEGQERWVPDLEDAEVVRTEGDTSYCRGRTAIPMLRDREWELQVTNGPRTVGGVESFVSEWTMTPGYGNMDSNDGYWLVQPFNGDETQSLVRYVFEADSGISAPDSIERNATRRMMPGIIEGLRRRHSALY